MKADNISIFDQDIETVVHADFIPWEELRGATLLLTGGTGLIGYTLVSALRKADELKELDIRLLLLVRNTQRALERFHDLINMTNDTHIAFLEGTVEDIKIEDLHDYRIDYIIHGASNTNSKDFVSCPVETIETSIFGTRNLLRIAKEKEVKSIVYLSSMEVYGYPEKGHKVTEQEIGNLSPLDVRNSYPISKIMSEEMCAAYEKEYQVPVKIVRLTQTFGPGVHYDDNRIFAYFLRCITEKKDIVLKTKGETERSYLYTADAATAILTVLLKGTNGEAYNAANEATYCSIAQMAQKIAKDAGIKVLYDIQNETINGYPQTLYMDLDTSKLRELGWNPAWGY